MIRLDYFLLDPLFITNSTILIAAIGFLDLLDHINHGRIRGPRGFIHNFHLGVSEVHVKGSWHLGIKFQEAVQQSPEVKCLQMH